MRTLRGFVHSVTNDGTGSNFDFDMTSIRENSGFKVWAGSRKFLGRRIKNVWVNERVITMRIGGF